MVKFNKRNNVIPVDFGEFKFEFKANDENLKKLSKVGDFLKDRMASLGEKPDIEAFDGMASIVADAWNEIFGQGAYDKVFEFAGESTVTTVIYFLETVSGINAEYDGQLDNDVLAKYLQK